MRKRWLWVGIGVGAICVLALAASLLLPKQENNRAAPVQNTTRVSKNSISVSISGSGSIVSTESESVRTKDEGKVSEVLVKTGEVVKTGQALLTFEGTDNTDALEEQQSSLTSQQLDLKDLQEQFKRQVQEGADEQSLNATKKSITKQELGISNTEAKIATLQEEMAPPAPLTSPIDGTITSVNITAGEQAKNGAELFVINDYQQLSVKIQVDELDIPQVEVGMKSTVQIDALPDKEFEGQVTEIANEGAPSNGVSLFDVTIALNSSDGVRVGMSAEATVIISEKQDVLTLPIEAVQQRGERYVVILAGSENATGIGTEDTLESRTLAGRAGNGTDAVEQEQGTAASDSPPSSRDSNPRESGNRGTRASGDQGGTSSFKEVEVGVHNESLIEIVSGLAEGEEVVIPTVMSPSNATNGQQDMMMQRGFSGGMGGEGGGFGGTGGGFGGGAAPSGGRSGFSGGGGR